MAEEDFPLSLPSGQEVEVEFIGERKPCERGWVEELDFQAKGFLFVHLEFQTGRSVREGVRCRLVRKWVNFDVVAEIRFLQPGTLEEEIRFHRELNRRLREGRGG